ncbi:MAG: permease, partial [Brevundimonas sp.]
TGRIAKAAGLFLLVRVMGYGLVAAAAWNGWLNVFQYLLPAAATALALRSLFTALKPRRRWLPSMSMKKRAA